MKHTPNSMLCCAAPPHKMEVFPHRGFRVRLFPDEQPGRQSSGTTPGRRVPVQRTVTGDEEPEQMEPSRESSPELTRRSLHYYTPARTQHRHGSGYPDSCRDTLRRCPRGFPRTSSADGTPERLGHRWNPTLRRPVVFSLRPSKFGKEFADCSRAEVIVSKACTPGTLTSDVTPGGVPWSVG